MMEISDTARSLLENIRLAQSKLGTGQTINGKALTAGQGIVAATGQLDTGFGYDYYPRPAYWRYWLVCVGAARGEPVPTGLSHEPMVTH